MKKELARSRTWETWAVGAIFSGQLSPSFLTGYRHWLLFQGRDFYESVLHRPEEAASRVPADTPCSQFATLRWIKALHAALSPHPGPSVGGSVEDGPAALSGHPWHWRDLPRRHPELWKIYFADRDRRAFRPPERTRDPSKWVRLAAFPLDEWIDVHDDPEYLREQYAQLSAAQSGLHAVSGYELHVRTAGLHSFLTDEWGNVADQALRGLDFFGCPEPARKLREAAKRLPGGRFHASPAERRRQLEVAFGGGSIDDVCDAKLLEGVRQALSRYVLDHPASFFREKPTGR